MSYPQWGRSMKACARGNNGAPSITMYGSPVRLDTKIVALRPHYTRNALRAPPTGSKCNESTLLFSHHLQIVTHWSAVRLMVTHLIYPRVGTPEKAWVM